MIHSDLTLEHALHSYCVQVKMIKNETNTLILNLNLFVTKNAPKENFLIPTVLHINQVCKDIVWSHSELIKKATYLQ